MSMTAPAGIKRGRMADEEKAEIERLAASLRRPTPHRIARRLNRHPATVAWFMLTRGLISRAPGRAPRAYERNGQTIYPWAPEHDLRLTELLVQHERQGGSARAAYAAAAEALTREFGIPRNAHTCRVRSVLLAAAPDEEAA